jgi:hypothetical protein
MPIKAFLTTYFSRPKIEYLFQHISWNENIINSTLASYGWEGPGTVGDKDAWRSGDGTVAFYNYLYYQLLGFNERTTHLSNKVRSNIISREQALELEAENLSPDLDGLREYASLVGFQLDEFLRNFNGRLRNI